VRPADADTIVASATPTGRSALALLRLSGADARSVAAKLCPGGPAWLPRRASLRRALHRDGSLLDQVLVTWMPGPGSYTGEDVVELSCHGNPVIVEGLLDALVVAGARPARKGEFTRRAFLHGRVDLVQAEAVAALIAARSPAALAVSRRAMERLGPTLADLREATLDLAAELEAGLDHPGEDLGQADDEQLAARLRQLAARSQGLASTWRAGRVRLEGARVALVGPVNVGKSSLFNSLLAQQRALVSDQAGTTRDVVERSVLVDGLEITWLDTAGERDSSEPLERAGIALGRELVADADLLLVVVPGHQAPDSVEAELLHRTADRPRLLVASHVDLPQVPGRAVDHRVSGKSGQGVAALRQAVVKQLGQVAGDPDQGALLVSQRQHELLLATSKHLAEAAGALCGLAGPAVAAEECSRALERLSELSGEDAREDVLDRVFARFCIGK